MYSPLGGLRDILGEAARSCWATGAVQVEVGKDGGGGVASDVIGGGPVVSG